MNSAVNSVTNAPLVPAGPNPTAHPVASTAAAAGVPASSMAADPAAEPTALPAGARRANTFNLFNAFSWQITLGAPLILYAKSLGAPATLLGILASFMPLLVIFQIPAARHIPRYGYRRFMLAGWGARTALIFFVALIPLLGFLPSGVRLALLVACLFGFNLLRGISSGAWFPWMAELVPPSLRGRFLSREQAFIQIGSLASVVLAALVLWGSPASWQFALIFTISALGATASLCFLNRIPDVTAPETIRRSSHRVPWKQMLFYPPFFRLMLYNLLQFAATGSYGVFTIDYLKGQAHYSESLILALSTLSIVGALVSVHWTGRVLDRIGSKPILGACIALFVLILAGWWLVAARIVPHAVAAVAGLNLLVGIAGANWGVANSRLAMATMPLMGRNHFFALFTVITNVGLGLAPILWGVLLDSIGARQSSTGLVSWNRYSLYFASATFLCLAAGLYAALGLHEVKNSRCSQVTNQ